jgi:hypothetical protein
MNTEEARRALHTLLRWRYNRLIQDIIVKFNLMPEHESSIRELITTNYIDSVLHP